MMNVSLKLSVLLFILWIFSSTLFVKLALSFFILELSFGIVLGSLLVYMTNRYYIHNGLTVLAVTIALALALNSLLCPNLFTCKVASFMLGIMGSLLLIPLYSHIIAPLTKVVKIVLTLSLVGLLIIASPILQAFLLSQIELNGYIFHILFWLLVLLGIRYLLFEHKYKSVWLFFLLCKWILSLRYKIVYEGLENLDSRKGILLISNHVSWLDWVILQLATERRVHYMINKRIYNTKIVNIGLRLNECIPVSKKASGSAFKYAKKLLKMKQVIGIFPEGAITKTGEVAKFFPGFELLKGVDNVSIVPVYIDGLWGSKFSYSKKKFCSEKSAWRRVVRVNFASELPLESTALEVKEVIQNMKGKKH